MNRVYNESYLFMEPHHEVNPQNPVTAYWMTQQYAQMERELAFPETQDKAVWEQWKTALRSRLREIMYIDTWGDTARVPVYEVMEEIHRDNYLRQKICFESVPGNYAIAYLLIPEGIEGKTAAIVCPCGHTQNGVLTVVEPDLARQEGVGVAYAHEFAQRGCVAIALESAGYAQRDVPTQERMPQFAYGCEMLYKRLNHMGRDLTGLRIFEQMLCLNLLCSLPMVDEKRVGCAGLSGGCWQSQVLTALDDRIRAVILCGYFTTFAQTAWNGHCLCHHPHGIGKVCEMPDISALIAPRPQFVESGAQDIVYQTEPAYSMVKRAYVYHNAAENLDIDVYEGGHLFNGRRSIPWMLEKLNVH